MPFCFNCGNEVTAEMRFCPVCGSGLNAAAASAEPAAPAVQTPVTPVVLTSTVTAPVSTAQDYRLVLVSCGSCTKTTARELFRDIFSYTILEATNLTNNAPIELAVGLSFRQALNLSQLFTEYGMQISVFCGGSYVDVSPYATDPVITTSGTLLGDVAQVLATITVANKVASFMRWSVPDPLRYVFRPRYRYGAPPVYERRVFNLPRARKPAPPARRPAPPPARRPGPKPPRGGGKPPRR